MEVVGGECVNQNIFDYGRFDNDYEDMNPLLNIIAPLFWILIGIPLYWLYLDFNLEKTNAVPPFSIGNYAHAQYMHWEEEAKHVDCKMFTRWNLP